MKVIHNSPVLTRRDFLFVSNESKMVLQMSVASHLDAKASERAQEWFFELGIQYYLSAKFAIDNQLLPVAGTLFHYAIEMLLKGCLTRGLTLAEMRKLGHSLCELWGVFRLSFLSDTDTKFDVPLQELDQWEWIRYPDRVLTDDMSCSVGSVMSSSSAEPSFIVRSSELDELARLLFRLASVSPEFFARNLPIQLRRQMAF